MDPFARMYFSLLRETDQRNTRSAGRVLVNSRYVEEAVSRIYGVSASVSYHGVDTDFFRPLDLPRGRFVLSVGSLTPMKAFDFLIESVAAIAPEKRPPLVIASNSVNPPEREYLLRLAEDSAVRIDLLENIDNQRLLQLYNEAGVVAYAPLREPFGLVPLEAMACAAPLVAVREGGIKESVVDRTTGLLVDRNPVSFGNAIRMLLDDPQLAARYGRQGREEVRTNWSWESAMATLQAHLSAALPMTESGPPAVVAARH
jgi:glycosyltransferase involved in cell wall biosynthesis